MTPYNEYELILLVKPSPEMLKTYQEHNFNLEGDSGYDLVFPNTELVYLNTSKLINMQVAVAPYKFKNSETAHMARGLNASQWLQNNLLRPVGYTIDPRSSIGRSPFRLANSSGKMDRYYRGNIFITVDYFCSTLGTRWTDYPSQLEQSTGLLYAEIKAGTRLFQATDNEGIRPVLVEELPYGSRGDRGFGSTGA
jgi:dUTPase